MMRLRKQHSFKGQNSRGGGAGGVFQRRGHRSGAVVCCVIIPSVIVVFICHHSAQPIGRQRNLPQIHQITLYMSTSYIAVEI